MNQSRVKNVISWVIQILLAAFYVLTASGKLMSRPQVIEMSGTGGFLTNFIWSSAYLSFRVRLAF